MTRTALHHVTLIKADRKTSVLMKELSPPDGQADRLAYLGHGSGLHSVANLCPPPAGSDTPPSCGKTTNTTDKLLSSSAAAFSNYRQAATCPVCSTAC